MGSPHPDLRIGQMDRALAALARVSPGWFHLVVDLDGSVAADALAEAWARLGEWHPALRARGELGDRAEWALAESMPAVVRRVESTAARAGDPGPGPVELAHLGGFGDLDGGPLCDLALLDRSDGTRLVLSLHHVLADAASGLELFDRLRRFHLATLAGDRTPVPADVRPRVVEDLLDRSIDGPAGRTVAATRHLARWWGHRTSAHPAPDRAGEPAGYGVAELGDVVRLTAEARAHHDWRLSAVLLALVSRAWWATFAPGERVRGPDGWQVAADLRRELGGPGAPAAGGIGNFSATEPLQLRDPGGDLVELVAEANRQLAGLASTWPGVGIPVMMAAAPPSTGLIDGGSRWTVDRVRRLRSTRSFSNIGPVPRASADWGPAQVTRLRYAPAMTDPEWVTVGVQGLGSSLLMAMRTHGRGIGAADVVRMGEHMVDEAARLAVEAGR